MLTLLVTLLVIALVFYRQSKRDRFSWYSDTEYKPLIQFNSDKQQVLNKKPSGSFLVDVLVGAVIILLTGAVTWPTT